MRRLLLALTLTALAAAPATPATADSAPDAGKPFEPKPKSQPLYGTQLPTVSPAQRTMLKAADGTDLFVETWLPAEQDGNEPPAKVPTVLIATPYVKQGVERYPTRNLEPVIEYFNARGYAVAQHHIRGTGESGGCLEQTADKQIGDVAQVIEWLGKDAPWTSGAVGMYGHSYDAETQVSTAGRGDPEQIKYLKAIVPSATVGGQYEYSNRDGVPFLGQATLSNATYLGLTSMTPGNRQAPVHFAEKTTCFPELAVGGLDPTGDMTAFWRIREYRPEADRIEAATLWVHGLRDFNVQPVTIGGFFDRLPATTPKAGLFGVWEHNYPDKHSVEAEWARPDFLPMVLAWYDRYLKGLNTGVEKWPVVQVQDSTGQWRAEPDFPSTGGPVGQLALGAGGALGGTSAPAGSTALQLELDDPVTFTTPAVEAPLHLTGIPVADLMVTTDLPKANLVAALEVLGADGAPLRHDGNAARATYGYRSLMHLDDMPKGYFEQASGKLAPTGTPIRVPIRFLPTDLVVPAGGKLRLTVGGSNVSTPRDAIPGPPANVSILHGCGTVSALRFLMPREKAEHLDVREIDEDGELTGGPVQQEGVDGGGLASAPVCDRAPERVAELGPKRKARATVAGKAPRRAAGALKVRRSRR